MHIRVDDTVKVMTGDDADQTGKVLSIDRAAGRLVVEGVNRVKRHMHMRPSRTSGRLQEGGIVTKELPVDLSNVQLVCKTCGKATRIGHRVENGVKVRICRRCESEN